MAVVVVIWLVLVGFGAADDEFGIVVVVVFGVVEGTVAVTDLTVPDCTLGNFDVVVVGLGILGLIGTAAGVGEMGTSWILPGDDGGI